MLAVDSTERTWSEILAEAITLSWFAVIQSAVITQSLSPQSNINENQ